MKNHSTNAMTQTKSQQLQMEPECPKTNEREQCYYILENATQQTKESYTVYTPSTIPTKPTRCLNRSNPTSTIKEETDDRKINKKIFQFVGSFTQPGMCCVIPKI